MPTLTRSAKSRKGPAISAPYSELCALLRDASTLGSIDALLNWDQETYMPPSGGAHRADQQAMLSALVHQKKTERRVGDLISACETDQGVQRDEAAAANVRAMRRDYNHATKIPTSLVAELARTQSQSQEVWKLARADNDFKKFRPWLEKIIELMRRKAQCLGNPPSGELYDNLLDIYEPGMTASAIEEIFTPLRPRLTDLVARLTAAKAKPNTKLTELNLSPAAQQVLAHDILDAMGFDLAAGRLDVTTHPFCSQLGPSDVRLTTRYTSPSFLEPISSTMHEAGHGLYDQGLPAASYGTPLSEAVSLGIHESQSRMWENFVGRSLPFWKWCTPIAKKRFGKTLTATPEQMYGAANVVRRSFIRVEADEATYNLHVMLRFEIERDLISGSLSARDLPGAWNALFKDYLGLKVPSDAQGCMQDVHWSFGLMGYFPTYTLGNLYAAQFWEKINRDITDLDKRMARGDFAELLAWLRRNIHRHGRRYEAHELCRRITGKPLSPEPLMRHLEGKLGALYGI
ncbi:thermostable carboxypeptidase 1 [soil metagenome]